jgi:hypothetical protein
MLALMLGLLVLGSCGIRNGARELTLSPTEARPQVDGATAEVEAAAQASAEALVQARYNAPLRRPLAATNIVVSVLLLLGGGMLLARRPTAVWMITQACWANLVWTAGQASSQLVQIVRTRERLIELIGKELDARLAAEGSDQASLGWLQASHVLVLYGAIIVAYAALRCFLYVWLMRRARRPDIRETLES